MANKITQTTLKNGMKVMLKEIHTAPIISSWVWYRVGSKDEPTGKTGLSHWTEHMQFKGTKKFPANVLDKSISREGGRWNASTRTTQRAILKPCRPTKLILPCALSPTA